MHKKRIRTLHTIIILLIIITIILLTAAGAMGALYVSKVREVSRLQREKEQLIAEQALPVLSVDVESSKTGDLDPGVEDQDMESAAGIAAAGEDVELNLDDASIAQLIQSKEAEVEQSIKDRMKELVTSEDGSPLKMLRSFFPENLIYSFEDEYVFAPVLDNVNKHSLLDENFEKTEDGLMQ
ncbi:MAG: hypothetical protein K2G51_03950, partial [Lachnospiraceae bacterium]|nr:hypothetical protein [Lachnospiraceae bacterium]